MSNVIFVDFINKRRVETKIEGEIKLKATLSIGSQLKIETRIREIGVEMNELYREGNHWGDEPIEVLQRELYYLQTILNKHKSEAV
jgi:hypothetical protein